MAKNRWLVLGLVLSVGYVLVGCSSNERTITPEEEKAWRHPPKEPPAEYGGPAFGGKQAGGPPAGAKGPPGSGS